VAYQVISGERQAVQAGYKILDAHTVTFAVGTFNHTLPLVIDPVLGYSTFFGGNNGESAWAIAINPVDNSIYLAGQTFSTFVSNGPPVLHFTTTNGYSTNFNGTGGLGLGDVFVAHLDSTGTKLLYCTYLGGSGLDSPNGIAIDRDGSAYVTGQTRSTDFPTTLGAFQPISRGGLYSTFVTKLDPAGSGLVYSTYLAGRGLSAGSGIAETIANGIAVDAAGDAYVTGITTATDFPTTPGAFQPALAGSADAFVTKLDPTGSILIYSTYLGGSHTDSGSGVALDANRNAYVTGGSSGNFPTTLGAFQMSFGGSFDAFVAKIVDAVPPLPSTP